MALGQSVSGISAWLRGAKKPARGCSAVPPMGKAVLLQMCIRDRINLQLAKKTPECLAYVVTHELVHLLERNHNERFQKYMDTFFPEWREVKISLNQQMLDYMSE